MTLEPQTMTRELRQKRIDMAINMGYIGVTRNSDQSMTYTLTDAGIEQWEVEVKFREATEVKASNKKTSA